MAQREREKVYVVWLKEKERKCTAQREKVY